jgi:hypothetical protein
MKSFLLVIFAIANLTGLSAFAGQRTFYWTGHGYSPYGYQACVNASVIDGELNAKRSCHEDYGMSYRVCQSGYISSTEVVESYSPYTGSCSTKVYITVNF